MDIYEKRRTNLLRLLDHHFDGYGRIGELARRLGWNPSRASAVTRQNNPKNLGVQAARLIELEFGLPRDWLDENIHDYVGSIGRHQFGDTKEVTQEARSIPLLKSSLEIERWCRNQSVAELQTLLFPNFPHLNMSPGVFVIQESTYSMPPMKPDDIYYINPNKKPKTGEKALFLIGEILVVGIFEQGISSSRITFSNGNENPQSVEFTDCMGVVVMCLMS